MAASFYKSSDQSAVFMIFRDLRVFGKFWYGSKAVDLQVPEGLGYLWL